MKSKSVLAFVLTAVFVLTSASTVFSVDNKNPMNVPSPNTKAVPTMGIKRALPFQPKPKRAPTLIIETRIGMMGMSNYDSRRRNEVFEGAVVQIFDRQGGREISRGISTLRAVLPIDQTVYARVSVSPEVATRAGLFLDQLMTQGGEATPSRGGYTAIFYFSDGREANTAR